MYSVVLMMAMTAPADAPQELFPNRPHVLFGTRAAAASGCSGAQATATAVASGSIFGVRDRLAERREVVAERRIEARAARAPAKVGAGCGGAQTFQIVTTKQIVTTVVPVTTARAGCGGGAATFGTVVVPNSINNIQPPVQGAIAGGLIQRAAVHRTLHKALRQGKLTPDEVATITSRADLYDKAVDASTKIIARNHAAAAPGTVGALGDGHILQMLLQNLPEILSAIKMIIALFG